MMGTLVVKGLNVNPTERHQYLRFYQLIRTILTVRSFLQKFLDK